jgi:hypothetical protein
VGRKRLLREVIAHAVLNVQPHIVRYYSAWEEDDHMLIQNEYCDGMIKSSHVQCCEEHPPQACAGNQLYSVWDVGGCLEDDIKTRAKSFSMYTEDQLKDILRQLVRDNTCTSIRCVASYLCHPKVFCCGPGIQRGRVLSTDDDMCITLSSGGGAAFNALSESRTS